MVSRGLYVEHSIRWASNFVIGHVWWEKLRLSILTPSVFDDDLRLFELRELTTSRSSTFPEWAGVEAVNVEAIE